MRDFLFSQFLNDNHIQTNRREGKPILVSTSLPGLWIIGYGIADYADFYFEGRGVVLLCRA